MPLAGKKSESKRVRKLRYTVPAVEKALSILQLFAADNQGHTLSEVSRALRLPVSTTSSLLYTMQDCGYLRRDESARFFLTMKLVTDAYGVLNQLRPREIAEQELRKLTERTGLTSCMAVLEGDQLVWVVKVDGTGHIKLTAEVGRRMYLHHTSTGKALLAYLPEEQVDAIVATAGLPASTARTITTVQALKKELGRVRTRGYAVDEEETATGVMGVAAPIFEHSGKLAGSAGAAGAVFEMKDLLAEVVQAVGEAAAAISEKLGYRGSA